MYEIYLSILLKLIYAKHNSLVLPVIMNSQFFQLIAAVKCDLDKTEDKQDNLKMKKIRLLDQLHCYESKSSILQKSRTERYLKGKIYSLRKK